MSILSIQNPEYLVIDESIISNIKAIADLLCSTNYKIATSSYISKQCIDILQRCKSNNVDINQFFVKYDKKKNNGQKYKIIEKCKICGQEVECLLTKKELFDYIDTNEVICANCSDIMKENMKQKEEKLKLDEKIEKLNCTRNNTENFIYSYLDINKSWIPSVKIKKRFYEIYSNSFNTNLEEIKNHICEMSYTDFLQTPYWKAIADYTKLKSEFKCQLCNSTKKLVTHHRTYEHHGLEHLNLSDLIVLCDNCHKKFHNIGGQNNDIQD